MALEKRCHVVSKGTRFGEHGYSAFDGTFDDNTLLGVFIKEAEISKIFVGGLATDYCVKATVLDALKHKLETIVLIDACRAVNVHPGDGDRAILEMQKAGAIISTTQEIIKTNP
ncbi:MAG: isochorismatase family protein [Parcubacteria group bacterium]|nr:isochorismatase family protein [Parcubacteria group bacterium]